MIVAYTDTSVSVRYQANEPTCHEKLKLCGTASGQIASRDCAFLPIVLAVDINACRYTPRSNGGSCEDKKCPGCARNAEIHKRGWACAQAQLRWNDGDMSSLDGRLVIARLMPLTMQNTHR